MLFYYLTIILYYILGAEVMSYIEKKPINRSKLRLFLGQTYYRIRKYFYWWLSKNKYSKNINKEELGYVIFTHSTPLYRKLRNVDMYL